MNVAMPVSVGWTPTATIGVVQTFAIVIFGGGGLYGLARAVALLWRMWNESKKLDSDGAAAVRKEMMDLNERQTQLIVKLEDDLRDERRRCDDETTELRKSHASEMAQLRKSHVEEMRMLHERIEGLHRQMVQMQRTTGQVIRQGANSPTTNSRIPSDSSGIGEVLRQTYDIPGTGDEI